MRGWTVRFTASWSTNCRLQSLVRFQKLALRQLAELLLLLLLLLQE
jgi:hypothetical protein